MKTRGFEIVTTYADQGIQLPQRSTTQAAGYDFEAAETVTLPGLATYPALAGCSLADVQAMLADPEQAVAVQAFLKPVLVPTGIKAYMGEHEYLQLVARSSAPLKKHLMMANGVGVVDADYYNNPKNEGQIFLQYINFGLADVTITKGERIGQGIFLPYLLADGDAAVVKSDRAGGFGSTGV